MKRKIWKQVLRVWTTNGMVRLTDHSMFTDLDMQAKGRANRLLKLKEGDKVELTLRKVKK